MESKHVIYIIIAALAVAICVCLLPSCKTPKPVVEVTNTEVKTDTTSTTHTETTVKETTKESEKGYTVEADSAYSALLFKCDSLGNAYLADIDQLQGKHTDLELQLKQTKEGALLQIKAIQHEYDIIIKGLHKEIERLETEKQQLSSHIASNSNSEKQEPIEIEKPIPAIVRWLAWIGGITILYILLRVALWVYKKFFLKAV